MAPLPTRFVLVAYFLQLGNVRLQVRTGLSRVRIGSVVRVLNVWLPIGHAPCCLAGASFQTTRMIAFHFIVSFN